MRWKMPDRKQITNRHTIQKLKTTQKKNKQRKNKVGLFYKAPEPTRPSRKLLVKT